MISNAQKARAEHAAHLFGLVASGTRVRILTTLMKKKELPVQDIAKSLGMTHSAVSHQLGLLSSAGIVSYKKVGRLMCYRLSAGKEAKALVKFVSSLA